MRFWKSMPGAVLLVVLLFATIVLGALVIRVGQVTRPQRGPSAALVMPELFVKPESVRFPSADGTILAGWLVPGKAHRPAIVLCHDLGGSKESLLNVAIQLQRAGFTLLVLDFRGHGESRGERSSLGIAEKRDVIGAVDYLATRGEGTKRIGVYGVGMGAFAATLAALDRPAIRVLVLDGLYPDVEYPLTRRVYENWSFGVAHLSIFPALVFRVLGGRGIAPERAADVLPRLSGRNLLLLAPARDSALVQEMERMYRSLPEERDSDGNMVTLPATLTAGLYAEDLERYLERVSSFFASRL